MNKSMWTYGLAMMAGATALTMVQTADAAVISILSDAGKSLTHDSGQLGDATAYDGFTQGGTAVRVAQHPAWQPENTGAAAGAYWISYGETGISPNSLLAPFISPACDTTTCKVLMTVTETINMGSTTGILDLNAWADDTVSIWLNGSEIQTPRFTQGTCADGVPGCQPGENAHVVVNLLAGVNTLEFRTYQVGTDTSNSSNPFGLLYSGTATTVPEPFTLSLLGAGLMGLGVAARRRRR